METKAQEIKRLRAERDELVDTLAGTGLELIGWSSPNNATVSDGRECYSAGPRLMAVFRELRKRRKANP